MKKLYVLFLFLISFNAYSQEAKISGVVTDESNQPLESVNISVKGQSISTTTNQLGNYTLLVGKISLPFTLVITSIGFESKEIQVSALSQDLRISLGSKTMMLTEVVSSASRISESILQSPVSIEKMTLRAIKENPSFTFYDGLANLKGVNSVTSSITYKQVNTRGFYSTGNARFLQLVDGVDNQAPGLNFSIGNQFGASDIDIESVEIIPGAASALYGPVAFNGVLSMQTKDPFKYQGISALVKTGVNHLSESTGDAKGLYDFAFRYAKAFNNKFAFKLNASYLTGTDWYATNYTDISQATPVAQRGPNNPGRDALNIYGDDISRTIAGIGLVSRTGYEEKDLMDYGVYSLKLNGALHYKLSDNLTALYQYNYGKGTASYSSNSRFSLNNFVLQTHRVELKSDDFFVRAYAVVENSHDSFNTRTLAQFVNRDWVRDLNGATVPLAQADNTWFTRYTSAFNGSITGVSGANHTAARAFADQGRLLPGTDAFDDAKTKYIHKYGATGAGVFSQSKFYHAEGQYNLKKLIKVFDLLAGGSVRNYDMFSNGSLFNDINQKILITEYGAFLQGSKQFFEDKLKFVASLRYDKNENFDGNFTPRISSVYSITPEHNFRASYQTGFRNPTPVDQFINLNAGAITILGGAPKNSAGLNVYENSFTAGSVNAFRTAYGAATAGGATPAQAIANNKQLLKKSNVSYIKPEQQRAFDFGYKGLINNKLMIDVNYYFSSYKDFILNTVVVRPVSEIIGSDGTISTAAAGDVPAARVQSFQLYTNAPDEVSSQGVGLALTYMTMKGYVIGGNVTWSDFNLKNANPNNVAAFNTPEYSTNVTFSNSNVYKNWGFNVAWHWQSAFQWIGLLTSNIPGDIDQYSLVDAQINRKFPKAFTTVKIGASNIFNKQVYQAYGSPTIGAMGYVSLIFDNPLK